MVRRAIVVLLCLAPAVPVTPASGQSRPAELLRGPPARAGDESVAAAPATTTSAPAPRPGPDKSAGFFRSLARAVSKIGWYFGLVGVASIVAWLAVWGVLVVWSARTRGMSLRLGASLLGALAVVYASGAPEIGEFVAFVVWVGVFAALAVMVLWAFVEREIPVVFAALILSIAAFGLGMWNSDHVDDIQLDRRAEIAAARQRQMQARQQELRKLKGKAADIHFAEDGSGDSLDLAGYKPKDANTVRAGSDPNDAGDYAYRQAGKKRRDANQLAPQDPYAKILAPEADDDRPFGAGATLLSGADYVLAGQLDRINRFAVRCTLVVALLLAGIEYLRRFNFTFGSILPLPVACRAIDSLWPKTHAVHLRTSAAETVREYLETVVHKGESFLYFAPADPWPGERSSLPRWPVRFLGGLRKIAFTPGDPRYAGEFVFESAWYGRYAFVVLADRLDAPAGDLLACVIEKLRMRRHTRATAGRSVHLVWHVPDELPRETLDELAWLCRETNCKLVVVSDAAPAPDAREPFDELITP